MVIDDLHELHSPEALAQLTRLLTNLPAHVHAILATRRDLRLRLHRLRLAGELAEIRAADLRFTQRETRELLEASGIALSAAGAALLHQRTEGWAAGLRLAALSLAGHPDPERFVAEFSGSDRTVAEYLLAEMLDRQPDDVQQLLLRTSLLDRVNGELADLLTGRLGSERILLELEDANAFVVSLDPERTWFRYHQLFGDFLRLELRRTLPEEVPALHRRAAAWFAEHGQVVEAIRHTQGAGDWPVAARLLADHSFSLTLDGQAQTIQALLQAFPRGAPRMTPSWPWCAPRMTCSTDTWTRRPPTWRSPRRTSRRRHQTASAASGGDRVAEAVAGAAARSPGRRHRTGQVPCLPGTGESDEDIALGSDLRAVALMNLGTLEAWSLGLQDAERHLQEGAILARSIGRPYLEVGCLAQLGFRVEDPLVRHDPAAMPRSGRARRAARLGRGAGDRARAGNAGRQPGLDGRA